MRITRAGLATIAALGAWAERPRPTTRVPAMCSPPVAAAKSAPPGSAGGAVLYDPAAGTLPAAQGWLYLTRPLTTPAAQQKLSGAALILDTTAAAGDSAGYFALGHPRMPILDQGAGTRCGWCCGSIVKRTAALPRRFQLPGAE